MRLQFFAHRDIDIARWDKAISQCENENPYAYSTWLNLVCPGWGAFINNDYSILIPIPLKSKFGIRYISQPLFTQQLGVFNNIPILPDELNLILNDLRAQFKKIHYQFSISNPKINGLKSKTTYTLPLNKSFDAMFNGFSMHHQRNINKAIRIINEQQGTIEISKDVEIFMQYFKDTIGRKDTSLKECDYHMIKKIIQSQNGKMYLFKTADDAVLGGLYSLESATKIVNLFNFVTNEGKEKRAMFGLVSNWIKQHAGSQKTLDFEGSEIESIAKFYHGFGATPVNYQIFTKKGFWQM